MSGDTSRARTRGGYEEIMAAGGYLDEAGRLPSLVNQDGEDVSSRFEYELGARGEVIAHGADGTSHVLVEPKRPQLPDSIALGLKDEVTAALRAASNEQLMAEVLSRMSSRGKQ